MRVLVLTSSTGGGHDMRARSFKQWAEHPKAKALGLKVKLYPTLESLHGVYKFGVEMYNWIQRNLPRLHHGYYNYLEYVPSCRSEERMLGREQFIKIVREFGPQVVLSVHDHLNHGFFDLAREAMGGHVRCVTYCGELYGGYGFSRHWVNPESDLFLGAVPEACDMASKLGMHEKRNRVGGFLLNPDFAQEPLSENQRALFIKNQLGLDPNKFILLLATGANGANNHLSILRALWKSGLRPQTVALCGRNREAQARIIDWAREHQELKIAALGYTDTMARLMEVSSAVLARPGTGTTSEAIVTGCPIIFNGVGGIMPQEWITVKYARHHDFGAVIKRPREVVPILRHWMRTKSLLDQQRQAMQKLMPVFDPMRIVHHVADIGKMVEQAN